MTVRIDPSWQRVLQTEFDKPYFELLTSYVRSQYQTRRCFPPAGLIFNAFDSCPFDSVRVVIIGQDPYHEEGQAMGLSFSVPEGVQIPPSLMNIYKEIHRDLGKPIPQSGDLRRWAQQGVLLLNATLTVEAHKASSGRSPPNANTSSSCSGAPTRSAKVSISTAANIWFSRPHILRRCPFIAVLTAAGILVRQITSSSKTASSQ